MDRHDAPMIGPQVIPHRQAMNTCRAAQQGKGLRAQLSEAFDEQVSGRV